MKNTSGFTLIELLITVAIVALLASVAMPLSELAVQRGKEQELRQSLREIRQAIDEFKRASDEGIIERPSGKSGYPSSLAVLVEGVPDTRSPVAAKFYFLRRIPQDPFAESQARTRPWGLRSYASPASDPRPGDDVFDVYSLAAGTGLNGIPYKDW